MRLAVLETRGVKTCQAHLSVNALKATKPHKIMLQPWQWKSISSFYGILSFFTPEKQVLTNALTLTSASTHYEHARTRIPNVRIQWVPFLAHVSLDLLSLR